MEKDYKKIIPPRFYKANYDNVDDDVKKIVKNQLEKKDGIFFFGDRGTGKTYITCAIARYLVSKGFPVLFYNTVDLMDRIRRGFENKDDNEVDLREIMNFKGLLILDDIGAEKTTEWTNERLYLLLNSRYENMLPVFFTSNLTLEELRTQISDRVVSRISGMTLRIKVEGDDRRYKKI